MNVGLERDLKAQRDRLVRIESEAKRKGWLKSAPLCAALGEASTELDDLPEAIDFYTAAIKNEKATFKLRAVEQLANLSARNAVRQYRKQPEEGSESGERHRGDPGFVEQAGLADQGGRADP